MERYKVKRRAGKMAVKMINCEVCVKEVAPSAKVCPSCGHNSKMGCKKLSLIGVGALLVLGIIHLATKGGHTSTPTETSSTSATFPTPVAKSADVVPPTEVASSNVNIKVLEVTTPHYTGRDSVKAYPQGSWMVVKLSIQNNQKEAINLTSSNFKFLNKEKREFTTLTGGTVGVEMTKKETLSFLTVNPGNTVEGYLAYDVPKGLTGFTMEASGCVTGTPIVLKTN